MEPYKVLWVEDEDMIVRSTQIAASDEKYNLDLVRFPSWETAKEELKANFEEYSAIVFDAFCVRAQGEDPTGDFIPLALVNLYEIFAIKGDRIPWYILSAGGSRMANFDDTVRIARTIRSETNNEWGEMYFHKDNDSTPALFSQIKEVAGKRLQNSVLYKQREVFAYLGEDKLIDSREAKKYMLNMLGALYFPEKNLKFQYEGNPIRKVLEHLFWAAKEKGLLPDECFNEKGDGLQVVLQNARKYMEGKVIPIAEDGKILYKVRWGKGREKIFDDDVAKSVETILDYANSDSHSDDVFVDEESPYFMNEDKKEQFFGYVMQLCYVIRWFGKYVEKHPDVETNKGKHNILDYTPLTRDDVIGKKFLVRNEGEFYRAGRCKISEECSPFKNIVGKECIIEEVKDNTGIDNKVHPFIATKIKPIV